MMAYFPNGTAGMHLDRQCADCPLGAGWSDPDQIELLDEPKEMRPCPVAFIHLEYNYDQLDKGNEQLMEAMTILVDDVGDCQVRKLLQETQMQEQG